MDANAWPDAVTSAGHRRLLRPQQACPTIGRRDFKKT